MAESDTREVRGLRVSVTTWIVQSEVMPVAKSTKSHQRNKLQKHAKPHDGFPMFPHAFLLLYPAELFGEASGS